MTVRPMLVITGLALWVPLSASQVQDRTLVRPDAGERRLALVIGNNNYAKAPLRNATADAASVATALRDVGFVVTTVLDADLPRFERVVDSFVAGLQSNDIALFFYAGHGLQIDGENYLVPIDFNGIDEADVRARTYSATRVLQKLEARSRIRLIVLDACRDNPFKTTRSVAGGLTKMNGRGSLIAFATAEGATASDNPTSQNGLFTEHLVAVLREPGLTSRDVFFRVRERVDRASQGRQFPWVSDGLVGDFVFRAGAPAAATSPAPSPMPSAPAAKEEFDLRVELAKWEAIGHASSPAIVELMIEDYLRSYPAGQFRSSAFAKLLDVRRVIVISEIKGTPRLRAQDLAGATIDALTKDCEAGHWSACVSAGLRHRQGRSVPVNQELGFALYARACAGGAGVGCHNEAFAYGQGTGVAKDLARAAWLYKFACDRNVWASCNNLGKAYEKGEGLSNSDAEAYSLYHKACSAKHGVSCSNLASFFELGRGTTIDRSKALEYYRMACAEGDNRGCESVKRLGGH